MKIFTFLLLLCLSAPTWPAAQAGALLKVGLFPNLTPLTLIAMYQPLRQDLEQRLGRPVELLTAPNFQTFATRTGQGQYDIILTAPHLARLAEQEGGYEAIATYDNKLQALIVVPAASPLKSLAELRGAEIAEPDTLAVVSMIGRDMLANAGVDPAGETWLTTHSHNGAVVATLAGRTKAAVIGSMPYSQMPAGTRNSLRIIAASRIIPNQVWLASRKLTAEERQAIQGALLAFADSATGQAFLKTHACGTLRKPQPGELIPMDPYARQVRALLESGK